MERKKYKMMDVFGILGAVFLPLGALLVGGGVIAYAFTKLIVFILSISVTGLPFLILGTVFLCVSAAKKKKIANLLENGRKINAKFNCVDINYAVKINHAHPYVVRCQYVDSIGVVHVFSSGILRFDPTEFLQDKEIPVYVDENNYKRYYMDLDSVLPDIKFH